MERSIDAIKKELRDHIVSMYLPGEDAANLPDGMLLLESGVLTSVNMLELVDHIESLYGIALSAHDIATRFDSIDLIADLVMERSQPPR